MSSRGIRRPFSSGPGLPDRDQLAKAIETTLMNPRVWRHTRESCEVNEYAIADTVLRLLRRRIPEWRCDCGNVLVRFTNDTWYPQGKSYHRVDGWLVCTECDWKLRVGLPVVWPEEGKGSAYR